MQDGLIHIVPTVGGYATICGTLGLSWAVAQRKKLPDAGQLLYFVLAGMLYAMIATAALSFESKLVPLKYDAVLFRVDAKLGFSTFNLWELFPEGGRILLYTVYEGLAFVMTLWAAVNIAASWGRYRAYCEALA